MESVLSARLEVPFWCSFRDPTGINVHSTFRLPPITSLYGLIANSLGLYQDDYSLRPRLRFAIAVERSGELVESYSKIMKIREAKTPEEAAKPGNLYISTSVIKQKLIQPAFWMYVLAEQEVLESIHSALRNPVRPLYLGESDDVVDLVNLEIVASAVLLSNQFDCGVHDVRSLASDERPAAIVNLPYHFVRRGRNDWGLLRRLYMYRLDSTPIILKAPDTVHNVCGKHILFEPAIME